MQISYEEYSQRLSVLQKQYRDNEEKVRIIEARATQAKRDLTEPEAIETSKALDVVQGLKGRIDQLNAMGRELGILDKNNNQVFDRGNVETVGDGMPGNFRAGAHGVDGYVPVIGKAKFADLFGESQADVFENFRDFLGAVEKRDLSRLRIFRDSAPAVKGLSESVPAEGGFLVGEQLWSKIWDRALEEMLIIPRCQVWPMTGPTLRVPAFDDHDRSASLYGGLIASWLAEAADGTVVNPKFRSMLLTAYKLGIYGRTTSELQEDIPGGANPLETALPRALAWFVDWYLIRGSGTGQPSGIMTSPATITVAKETGQTADTICYQNCAKMYQRCSAPSRATWFASSTCLPQLLVLSYPIGTAGQAVPVFDQGRLSLLGRPLVLTEKLPILGDEGDLMLCDLSQYAVGVRRQATLERTNLVSWTSDQIDFRILTRLDGQSLVDQPEQPKVGSTQSPFVILGAV